MLCVGVLFSFLFQAVFPLSSVWLPTQELLLQPPVLVFQPPCLVLVVYV